VNHCESSSLAPIPNKSSMVIQHHANNTLQKCAMVVSCFRSVLSHRRQWHLADSYPKYCSKACQGAHWPIHKNDCKSPLMKTTWRPQYDIEKRTPAFIDQNNTPESSSTPSERYGMMKYLWGNVPAIDVVKYSKNEGLNIPEELHFLFAG
jgi:hypothetical protein